jgi:hypothetical protein
LLGAAGSFILLFREVFAAKEIMVEGIFGLSLEFKNRFLIAEKYKKKQPTRFRQLAVKEENR